MNPFVYEPAHELARLIREGQASAVDVLDAHLRRIQERNRELNAIIILDDEEACRQAQDADRALGQGQVWGPLHGVPFTLKDHLDTAGMRSTMGGYPPFAERLLEQDSTVAARLKAAGGILMGKSNAVFFPFGFFGRSNNPWDLARCPGVSSSGAAAALAAGLTPLEVGSDTSGSILGPAHFCGVCGMRPTQNRVSLAGLTSAWPAHLFRQMTVFGPMARCIADLKLALQIIAGPDGRDFAVPPVPWREAQRPEINTLRIAWMPSIPGAKIDSEIQQVIAALAQKLAEKGVKIGRCSPDVDYVKQAELHRRLFLDLMLESLCQPSSLTIHEGEAPSLSKYMKNVARREELIARWERFFEEWDALLLPACGVTARRHGRPASSGPTACDATLPEEVTLPLRLAPATGHPALVFPIGLDGRGLPMGGQLIGRRWADEQLLALGEVLANAAGGFRKPPGFQ